MKELLFLREIHAPKYRIDLLYGCKATLFCCPFDKVKITSFGRRAPEGLFFPFLICLARDNKSLALSSFNLILVNEEKEAVVLRMHSKLLCFPEYHKVSSIYAKAGMEVERVEVA